MVYKRPSIKFFIKSAFFYTNSENINVAVCIFYFKLGLLIFLFTHVTTNKREISETNFPWLISKKVYLFVSKLLNRMIKSGLNNGQSKTSVVNISARPLEQSDKFRNPAVLKFSRREVFSERMISNFKETENFVQDLLLLNFQHRAFWKWL